MLIPIPSITSTSITPNPVSASTAFFISVAVTEVNVELDPIIKYAGTFSSGEEGEIY